MNRSAISFLTLFAITPVMAQPQPGAPATGLGDPCHLTPQALGSGPQSPALMGAFSFLCRALTANQAAAAGNPDPAQLQQLYAEGAKILGVDPQQFGHFQDLFAPPPEGNKYYPPSYGRGGYPYPFFMSPGR